MPTIDIRVVTPLVPTLKGVEGALNSKDIAAEVVVVNNIVKEIGNTVGTFKPKLTPVVYSGDVSVPLTNLDNRVILSFMFGRK